VSHYRFIQAERATYPVAILCRVLGVARSAYYAWARRGVSARTTDDEVLATQIAAAYARSRRTYGAPRIHAELRAQGIRCARKRVARLMRAAGLAGCHRRRRMRTTIAAPAHTPAPNLVARDFRAAAPNRLWFGDITYVATREGWLYLAVLLDAHSRRIVGWAMADHLRAELALDALAMAFRARRPPPGLVHHTDRGCQYTAEAYQARLAAHGIACSMSRSGDCLDNAVAESFFATLKAELVDVQIWPTRAAARLAIFEWIEVWYNRQRRHSTLGYLAPVTHERQVLLLSNQAA
jgi:transposase InsO family protein